jgi:putative transposase
MTKPRQLLPNSMYLVTRRCTQRQFLIKPSKRVNQVFTYLLAVAAKRYKVEVHAFCVLSNHWHAVVTDRLGNLPKFTEYVHKYAAKCVNASLCRWENMWASEPVSNVRLEGSEDAFDKILYTICNPVSSFLVKKRTEWPGLVADWTTKPLRAKRPDWFFLPDGPMPATATLELVAPKCFPGETAPELAKRLRTRAAQCERALREEAKHKRIRFLGAHNILRQRVTDSPHSIAARRGISPRVAAKDGWRRVEAFRRLKSFANEYRAAWAMWKAGFRDVVFPAGTYALRVHQGAPCAAIS